MADPRSLCPMIFIYKQIMIFRIFSRSILFKNLKLVLGQCTCRLSNVTHRYNREPFTTEMWTPLSQHILMATFSAGVLVHLVMCWAGLQALSLPSPACSSPSLTWPWLRLAVGSGLASDTWSPSLAFGIWPIPWSGTWMWIFFHTPVTSNEDYSLRVGDR